MKHLVRDCNVALNLTTIGFDFRAGFQTRLRYFFGFVVKVLLDLLAQIFPFFFKFLVLLFEESQLTHCHSLVSRVFRVYVEQKRCKV